MTRPLKWQLLIILLFIILSGLNYGNYHHQLKLIEAQAAGSYNANGLNEPLSDLSRLGRGTSDAEDQRKLFVEREAAIAVLAIGGVLVFWKRQRYVPPSSLI